MNVMLAQYVLNVQRVSMVEVSPFIRMSPYLRNYASVKLLLLDEPNSRKVLVLSIPWLTLVNGKEIRHATLDYAKIFLTSDVWLLYTISMFLLVCPKLRPENFPFLLIHGLINLSIPSTGLAL